MKKGIIAVVIILVAAAAVVVAVLLRPTQKPAPAPRPVAAQPKAPEPAEVVTGYLEAIGKKEYRAAYDSLSRESQQAHSYDEFVKLNEKGVTEFDLGTARAEPKGQDMVVTVKLREDPSDHGFRLVREDKAWRIDYATGTPSFPYAKSE